MTDAFVPLEIAVAPNPLGLPPNLKLTTVPIDAYTSFELWTPAVDSILLTEEAMLLRGDCARLEDICARLTSLLGATVTGHTLGDSEQPLPPSQTYSWSAMRSSIQTAGCLYDAITVNYLPQVIYPNASGHPPRMAWTLQPAGWSISFLSLQQSPLGFRVETLPIRASIVFGQAVTNFVEPALVGASC